jgi:hypothetical protein
LEQGTTLLLGLPGVAVSRVERRGDGTRAVHVVTGDELAGVCPGCGVVSTSLKGAVATRPRDIPYGTDGLELLWHKRRWRCRMATVHV